MLLPTQDYSTLERKYHTLQKHHESLKRQFEEKNNQLDQLRKLSEAMYKEYDELRTQYKLETSAMHQAMGRAHEWYKQNRELKRQSTALLQYVMEKNPDGVPILKAGDQVDSFSDQDNEIEALRKTIKDFTKDMSKLQAELNSLKMKESEAQEQITYLNKQLETERRGKLSTYTLGQKRDQGDTFTKINQNDNLEEKLRATEFELQLALDRANQAEAESQILSNKVSELVNELQEFKNKTVPTIPTAPAAPPPPPPPPLPPSFSGGSGLNITKNVVPRKPVQINQTEVSAFDEVGNFLEMPKTSGIPKIQNGVIDNIVEAIKKGQYNLKTTERQSSTKKEESSEVEHEIKNILGTWKRQPKKKKDF